MFTNAEDKLLDTGPTWHGTALGWIKNIGSNITKIPTVDERFCGIKYTDTSSELIVFSVYMPTTGDDDYYLDVLDKLSVTLETNINPRCIILHGIDSNQSITYTRRRTDAMKTFLHKFSLKSILPDDAPTFHSNNGSQ